MIRLEQICDDVMASDAPPRSDDVRLRTASRSSSEGHYYRPELDALRLVAFFFVLLHHMLPLGLGHLDRILPANLSGTVIALNRAFGFGLTLFFVLSAFLITELLLRERTAKGRVSAGQFYIRRILRIWPLYYFCVFFGFLIAVFLPSGPHEVLRISFFAVFMAAWDTTVHGWIQNPISPLWSISIEEQFYLFAPWLIGHLTRAKLLTLGMLVIVVSSWFTFLMGQSRAEDYSVWANPVVQSQAFSAGMIVCLMLNGRLPQLVPWQRVLLIISSLTFWFVATYFLHVRYFDVTTNPGGLRLMTGYLLGSIGAVFMLGGFLGSASHWFPHWTIYLGRISFGLYAFHEFAIFLIDRLLGRLIDRVDMPAVFLKFLPVVLLDILLATLSFRFLEKPFLLRKRQHALVSSEPVLPDSN